MRIGILGCGNIARVMAETIQRTNGVFLEAVAARDKDRAREFASRYGAVKSFGSYEELCSDPVTELIYVATTTNLHKEHMLLAIKHGKSVLCEKAFTVNEKEAEEVFAAAKEAGVLVAEAIWTRYMPSRRMINDIIASGRIGKVTSITANLSYKIADKERIADPALGGGAILDLGVYPLNFVLMARENLSIERMAGLAVKNELGSDIRDTVSLVFSDGSSASVFVDAETISDRRGIIYGTEGYIEVENVNNPEVIRIYSGDRRPVLLEEIEVKHQVNGYEYQLDECRRALEEHRCEVPSMPHRETLRVMRLMDGLRSVWGVKLGSEL